MNQTLRHSATMSGIVTPFGIVDLFSIRAITEPMATCHLGPYGRKKIESSVDVYERHANEYN